jgi:hypothetical protein
VRLIGRQNPIQAVAELAPGCLGFDAGIAGKEVDRAQGFVLAPQPLLQAGQLGRAQVSKRHSGFFP